MHPALQIPKDELFDGLQEMVEKKYVNRQTSLDGLHIYSYSDSCTFDRMWTPITRVARGLIIDPNTKDIVALPFPKFFNVGENADILPDLPFETFEKMDGSLIILFHYQGEWRTATRGSFQSEQAQWARIYIQRLDLSALDKDVTYLAEAIYPMNRIVVHYSVEGLFLLAAYRRDGEEMSYDALCEVSARAGFDLAKRLPYDSISDLLVKQKTLPATEEGWVLRFANGHRVKVKGDEYMRIHRLVSRLTPLAVWESMLAGDDLMTFKKELPEEFWNDFDTIIALLSRERDKITADVRKEADLWRFATDKQLGLSLSQIPSHVRPFIFSYRNNNGDLLQGRSRAALYRAIRPTGNRLDGYRPSSSVTRVMEEAS